MNLPSRMPNVQIWIICPKIGFYTLIGSKFGEINTSGFGKVPKFGTEGKE
jgi:hypothetical protein